MMNTNLDFNSTPKIIDRNKYNETLMDFSTPMSTINNSQILNKTSSNSNMNIVNKLLQKFNEHQTNFNQTQTYLNLLDKNLRELTLILHQLQNSLDHQSLLKSTTNELETRLLQMSSKHQQIRTVIDHFHQSPIINQTLDELIHQISPTKSQSNDNSISYFELINAVKLSLNQKFNLIERFNQQENYIKDRTIIIQQRQQTLLQLIEKLLQQQKFNDKHRDLIHPSFDLHDKQFQEFNELNDEYQFLQNEYRQLKQMTKENIKTLYRFIEPMNT